MHNLLSRNRSRSRRRRTEEIAACVSRATGVEALNTRALKKVALFPRFRLAYNRIQKNANSTAMVALHALEIGGFETADGSKDSALHLDKAPLRALSDLEDYMWFVIVRDPYTRTLSAFRDKFGRDKFKQKFRAFDLTADGFVDFLRWLEAGNLNANRHWDLQTRSMVLPLSRYSKVMRFEAFPAGFPVLLRELDPAVTSEQISRFYDEGTQFRTDSSALERQFYTPEARRLVSRIFASDFDVLGYPVRD
jgi:hypothetical protein